MQTEAITLAYNNITVVLKQSRRNLFIFQANISYSVRGLYYDIKQLVSMDIAVPVVYGSYTLEYNCHIQSFAGYLSEARSMVELLW